MNWSSKNLSVTLGIDAAAARISTDKQLALTLSAAAAAASLHVPNSNESRRHNVTSAAWACIPSNPQGIESSVHMFIILMARLGNLTAYNTPPRSHAM
jgi:hypothetical protein